MKAKFFIGLLLIITIVTGLAGCNYQIGCGGVTDSNDTSEDNDNGTADNGSTSNSDDDIPGKNPTENPNARYWGLYAIESYSDLQCAWDLMKKTNGNGISKTYYIFDGDLSDEYRTVYFFQSPNAWITYPITTEEYFTDTNMMLTVTLTSILFSNEEIICESCDPSRHSGDISELSDYSECRKRPFITIDPITIMEIEDTSLIALDGSYVIDSYHVYSFSYDGTPVFRINSCLELSDAQLTELVEHITLLK